MISSQLPAQDNDGRNFPKEKAFGKSSFGHSNTPAITTLPKGPERDT
jgi:hypothetical protein